MKGIYFDNSATTRPSEKCILKITEALGDFYANPSSMHGAGAEIHRRIESAREKILATFSTDKQRHRLIFTSGGSEANTLAILGCARSKNWRSRPKALIGSGEHPSVRKCAAELEKMGFEVVYIPTDGGALDMDGIMREADERVVLCSFMMVNNETGALYDVKTAFSIVKRASPDAVCHTDCVQAYLKVPINANTLGADLISVSAHKIHGPKGIGALLVNQNIFKRRLLSPVIFGGGQEYEMRAGTENTAYIEGFSVAAEESRANMRELSCNAAYILSYIKEQISSRGQLCGFSVNEPKSRVPYIISITTPNIKSETMLHYLSAEGIYVSSGSACSSHSKNTSEALLSFGLTADAADRTIRVSLSKDNTLDEAKIFIDALCRGAQSLVAYKKI